MNEAQESTTGLRVLVADDAATNRQLLQVFLRKLGCEVILAENGAEAVEMFRRERPDIVLMDIMMPVTDGFEATRRIKALATGRWTPVVFLSALDRDEHLVQGLEAGGDDYLAKPINFVVLEAKLASLARTLSLQRRLDESRRRMSAIADNMVDCVFTINENGIIQSANAAVTAVFGYATADLVGRNVSMLMPEPYRSTHDDLIRRYLDTGQPNIIGKGQRQVAGVRKDGSPVSLELGLAEVNFEGQRIFVGILRDISARVSAEQRLREHAAQLQRYHDEREAETALAGGIMKRILLREGLADPRLSFWLAPASAFSGDVVAAGRSSSGRLYAMLADATGHGLAAAISALPVLSTFYGLVEQDHPVGFIAMEMNRQLMAFMPSGRFVAATLVCIDQAGCRIQAWVGGMPGPLLLLADGSVRKDPVRSHLPLGIVNFDEDMATIETIDCPPASQLVLYSDGLGEAVNDAGEQFGADRLLQVLLSNAPGERRNAVKAAVSEHLGGQPPHDDISLLLIDC